MKKTLLSVLLGIALIGPVCVLADDDEHERFADDEMSVDGVLAFVEQHSPPFRKALGELRRVEPEAFEEAVEDLSGFIREYREVQRHEPEEAKFMLMLEVKEVESELVAHQFHEAESAEEKAKLREQLARRLNELFELKQHANEKELHYLEREVRALRERLHRRAEHRERIIERRMKDLLGDQEDDWMDW